MNTQEKQHLIDAYIDRANPMPTLPEAVVRILELSNNPNVEVEDVADAILMDKVLTARMIRLVNSAFWGIRRHIASVREAIVYLGLHQIRSIVLTTSLFNTFHSKNPSFRVASIWEHGLGCAMISRIIAQKVGFADLELAYLGGLMHDIGEIVLSQFDVEKYDNVIEVVQDQNIPFHEAENQVLGINHTDFGEWFKDHWGFSEEMTEVITKHHSLEEATINPPLVSVVSLANLFCQVRGLDYGYSRMVPIIFAEENAWQILSDVNPELRKIDLARFTLDLDGMVEDVRKIVKDVYQNNDQEDLGE